MKVKINNRLTYYFKKLINIYNGEDGKNVKNNGIIKTPWTSYRNYNEIYKLKFYFKIFRIL